MNGIKVYGIFAILVTTGLANMNDKPPDETIDTSTPESEHCEDFNILPSCSYNSLLKKVTLCIYEATGQNCREKTLHGLTCIKQIVLECSSNQERTNFFQLFSNGEKWLQDFIGKLNATDKNSEYVLQIIAFTCPQHTPSQYPIFETTLGIPDDFCPSATWDKLAKWFLMALNRYNEVTDGLRRCSMFQEMLNSITQLLDSTCSLDKLPNEGVKGAVLCLKNGLYAFMNDYVITEACTVDRLSCPQQMVGCPTTSGCHKAASDMCTYQSWREGARSWINVYYSWLEKCGLNFGINKDQCDGGISNENDNENNKWSGICEGMEWNKDGYIARPYLTKLEIKCVNENKKVYGLNSNNEKFYWCADGKYTNWCQIMVQRSSDFNLYKLLMNSHTLNKEKCPSINFGGDCGFVM